MLELYALISSVILDKISQVLKYHAYKISHVLSHNLVKINDQLLWREDIRAG